MQRILKIGAPLFALALVVALGFSSRPAAAAPLVSITWDVTSGTVFGPGQWGLPDGPIPIDGGTLSFVLDTPTETAATPTVPGAWSILITSPSGTFSVAGLSYSAAIGPLGFQLTAVPLLPFVALTGTTGGGADYFKLMSPLTHYATAVGGAGSGAIFFKTIQTTLSTYYAHSFAFGNEIRVYTPEPSTGSMLLMGLALLGFPGVVARRRWRVRN